VVSLGNYEEIHEVIIPFLNRLSDLLFTLGRFVAIKTKVTEIPWISGEHTL